MNGSKSAARIPRSVEAVADAYDLRSVIAAALASTPIDEDALRHGVWTFVGTERDGGVPPGQVIIALTELIDAARISPMAAHQMRTRCVILWCVEAYFGHLGGDVLGRQSNAFSDVPRTASKR